MANKTKLVRPLSPAAELFACALARGLNQSDAYREAYPHSVHWKQSAVHSKSAMLAADERVKAKVRELLDAAAEVAVVSAADTLKDLTRLLRFDIRKLYRADGTLKAVHELDAATAAAIQAVDVNEEWIGVGKSRKLIGHTKRYRLVDKRALLDMAMKHHGLYEKDNRQLSNPLRELAAALTGKVVGAVAETGAEAGAAVGLDPGPDEDED